MNNTTLKGGVTVHPMTRHSCQVSAIAPLSRNTFQVDLNAPADSYLGYHAGQYLQLELDLHNDGKPLALSYSIANHLNPEHPQRLQLFIHNGSELTSQVLSRLDDLNKRNANINVTLPMGRAFLQTPLDAPHLLVAAGSGIAKIKCITEAILEQHPKAAVHLYWSNKAADDFYLLDHFQGWEARYRNLRFTPILEKATPDWHGRSGYIYEIIQENFSNLKATKIYLCGSPQMVYGTIDRLKPSGLNEENCYSDVFEYAPRAQAVAYCI